MRQGPGKGIGGKDSGPATNALRTYTGKSWAET